MKSIIIHKNDNVKINLENGHKYAIRTIAKGDYVIKYGQPIGIATQNIPIGEHVHTHNLTTSLSGKLEYQYTPENHVYSPAESKETFSGYVRENGDVGIRNDVWIVNTVGCVNKTAEILSKKSGAKFFPHPFGCSQMGDDQALTQTILKGMVNHPNAGAVLVLGLGCENNNIEVFQKVLGEWNPERVKFLNVQDHDDEISVGLSLLSELKAYADRFTKTQIPLSKLKVGLKCGGSDGFSGITANPLLGRFCDRHTAIGGSCVLTEVPEMFGAEHLLMNRCVDASTFEKTVSMINRFKDYYIRHNQVIYDNPSPGNKKGGISTLEEKSLGCIQKGGLSPVVDVLDYGDTVSKSGLSLLNGPGNDMIACTNLMAAGCHLILFTTGRGTPFGTAVPTVKVSTNQNLAAKKKSWIDYDASPCIDGIDLDDDFYKFVCSVANGEKAKNEIHGYEEISIFKDGVTL